MIMHIYCVYQKGCICVVAESEFAMKLFKQNLNTLTLGYLDPNLNNLSCMNKI